MNRTPEFGSGDEKKQFYFFVCDGGLNLTRKPICNIIIIICIAPALLWSHTIPEYYISPELRCAVGLENSRDRAKSSAIGVLKDHKQGARGEGRETNINA